MGYRLPSFLGAQTSAHAFLLCMVSLLLLGSYSASSPADIDPDESIAQEIDDILHDASTAPAFWGAYVRDLETGQTLYEHNGQNSFIPASNQKLFTVATALDALGSDHRYETPLYFDGEIDGAVMRGDLLIVGSGDPTFGTREIRDHEDALEVWAQRLASMGVERIEGRLLGDASVFDGRPYAEGWDVDIITQQTGRNLGASAGGLSYRDNVVTVRIDAGAPGEPPSIDLRPNGTVTKINEATTSNRRRGSSVQVNRSFSSNEVTISGSVPLHHNGTVTVPVSDPLMFTLKSFEQHLESADIETDLTLGDVEETDDPPNTGPLDPLFVSISPPLEDIAAIINQRSDNFYAEQLFRTYGWAGSAEGGIRRTETFLSRAGISTRNLSINDGSGLSRKDLLTPQATVDLLAYMQRHGEHEAFTRSLPMGGEPRSTLRYRLRNLPVQAKTGSLRSVRTLSGYVTRSDGHRLAFALYANNYTVPSYRVTNTFDRIVRLLTEAPVS